MIWIFGYLIGIILFVIVLCLTGFDCDDDETVWLVAVIWPLILIVYFLLLIYAIGVFFINEYFYINDKIRKKRNKTFLWKKRP